MILVPCDLEGGPLCSSLTRSLSVRSCPLAVLSSGALSEVLGASHTRCKQLARLWLALAESLCWPCLFRYLRSHGYLQPPSLLL